MDENVINEVVEEESQIGDELDTLFPKAVLQTKPTKKLFVLSRRDLCFGLFMVIASVLLSAFGICGGFSGGFGVTSLILLAVTSIYFSPATVKTKPYFITCGILSALVSIGFVITTNGSVRFWSVIAALMLSGAWIVSRTNESEEDGDLSLLKFIILPMIIGGIDNIFLTISSVLSGESERRKTVGGILIGVLLAIPCLFVIVPLLMSGDAAFESMVSGIFDNLFVDILKIILGIIISVFVISYCFTLKNEKIFKTSENKFKGIENAVLISFLSVLSLCYIAYLFSQFAYFFDAFRGILPTGYSFTVAEYARRGFFEMTAIVAINLVVIFACLLLAKKSDGKICVALRVICTFIGVFTLIIIATALSKMVLYINSFGMTVLRITTSAFMVFLAVVFASVMLRIFIPRIRVLRTALVTAGLVLTVLGCANVNNMVASYNYNAYKNGTLKNIDIQTIYELGEEGVPYLIKLADSENKDIKGEAIYKIKLAVDDLYDVNYKYKDGECVSYEIKEKRYDDIGQMSIPRSKAYKQLDKFIKDNPKAILDRETSFEYEEWF